MARFTNPNYSREFVAGLPEAVRNRVKALVGLDKKFVELKNAHESEIVKITRKYELLLQPFYERRSAIVNGAATVTAEDINGGYPADHEGKVEKGAAPATGKALPEFWLKALRHHCIIDEMITDRDDEALTHLIDIRAATLESPQDGFVLQFIFKANDFFEETELNKTFFLAKMGEDWTLEKTESTKISWKTGKNLTVKTVTKKQKSKAKKGAVRFVTEEEPCESFFHFFDNDEDDDFAQQWFAMAQTIKEKIVPFAVNYYTGEAPDGSSDIDDDEWDGEEGEEDEEEEEEEEEPAPKGRGGKGPGPSGGRGGYSGGAPAPGGKDAKDCKQQ